MEWRGTQSAAYTGWVVMAGVVLAAVGVVLLAAGGPDAALWSGLLCLAAGVIVAASGIVFGRMALVLDATGVHLSFGPWGLPRRDVPWSAVRAATVVDVRWLPWGGWGLRWRPGHGTAALLRQGPGVEFGLADGRVLVVTLDEAQAAADAARAWLAAEHD
jgi:hypothetical protein